MSSSFVLFSSLQKLRTCLLLFLLNVLLLLFSSSFCLSFYRSTTGLVVIALSFNSLLVAPSKAWFSFVDYLFFSLLFYCSFPFSLLNPKPSVTNICDWFPLFFPVLNAVGHVTKFCALSFSFLFRFSVFFLFHG
jgi:hypothetical protein